MNFLGRFIASDHFARRFPISVKGIVCYENKVLLLQNERGEWDLPGGKLSSKESLSDCLKREVYEETQLKISVHQLLDTWKTCVMNQVEVLIVVYYCQLQSKPEDIQISFEHLQFGFFGLDNLEKLSIDVNLKNAISKVKSLNK